MRRIREIEDLGATAVCLQLIGQADPMGTIEQYGDTGSAGTPGVRSRREHDRAARTPVGPLPGPHRTPPTWPRYQRWLAAERGVQADDYASLWQWSVDNLEDFWASIWDYFEVRAETPYERVLGSREMPGAEWFTGARLSYAQHVLDGPRRLGGGAAPRIGAARAGHASRGASCAQQVARIAAGLKAMGVEPGDRVVAYMPNIAEALAAFLACSSIGAVWSSCSPDFGAKSVVDRFAQIEPKVLLAVDGYRYNGKDFDRRETVEGIAAEIGAPVVWLGYLDGSGWQDGFLGDEGAELEFVQLPFDHPLWVLYSSGTTGLPKAIVHGQGGILLEHLKQMFLHVDAQKGDRVFWFTTTGWMMWNFLAGVLLTDAEIVLYDGSPGHPDLGVLWDLAERTGHHHVRHLGRLPVVVHEGGHRAGGGARPVQAHRGRLDGLTAVARGLPVGLRPRGRRHLAVLHLRRHRRVHGVRGRRADAAGVHRRAAGPRAGLRGASRGTRTATR